MLSASSIISNLCWPSYYKDKPELSQQYAHRGTTLRNLLSIDKRSPFNSRRLRNSLKHFDERIHEWLRELENDPLVCSDRIIADMRSSDSGNNVSTGERKRSAKNMVRLDPENLILSYL
jgi:Tfp pilus assembly protein PilO